MAYWSKLVVAKKSYNNVTIGYIVGWKHRYCGMVRNIRANLVFDSAVKARRFKSSMESKRISPYVEFEILDDKRGEAIAQM